MKKKEFLTESKRKAIISEREKSIVESFAKNFNKIKRIDENEVSGINSTPKINEANPQIEDYYVAISNDAGPGKVRAIAFHADEYNEVLANGWSKDDITGPYTEDEAYNYVNSVENSNRKFHYFDKMDDREGKSNLYIDPLDKFERDSLDTNW